MAKAETVVKGMPKVRETENGQEKWCPRCAKYFPADLDHFYKDGRGKLGLSSWCKACQCRKKEDVESARAEADALEAAVMAGEELVLELDFSSYPDLLALVKKSAVAEFRPVDLQVMALIDMGLKGMESSVGGFQNA